MAQQTINIGASPNDGTGTPLRTAFQYTNSNFSELYTAVGPSGNNIVVPGNATITGDLTVDTSTLKVDSANNRVIVGHTSGSSAFQVTNAGAAGIEIQPTGFSSAPLILSYNRSAPAYTQLTLDGSTIVHALSGTTAMTLNSTGLGVGGSPSGNAPMVLVEGAAGTYAKFNSKVGAKTWSAGYRSGTLQYEIQEDGTERFVIANGGNVGIGVTPSAKLHVSDANLYAPSLTWNTACAAIVRSENGQLATGSDSSGPYAFWMQVRTIGNSARDISLNPLGGNVIIGSRTANNGKLTVTETANSDAVQLIGSSGTFARFYGWSVDNTWNANATAIFVGKQTSTSRSINAGGTVNASGADYAEYMTKAGDFVLSKGGIAGIDANGKLTNVFADAVSFVVKSTDPSYVGNDKWGVGLEGDALETARQLVDRIAFAGQVPVNVTGAKAGDYIVPVVDGTGIKGIAVSNPTFEQYQLAVGKVIAIDTDGRARIIVKVA